MRANLECLGVGRMSPWLFSLVARAVVRMGSPAALASPAYAWCPSNRKGSHCSALVVSGNDGGHCVMLRGCPMRLAPPANGVVRDWHCAESLPTLPLLRAAPAPGTQVPPSTCFAFGAFPPAPARSRLRLPRRTPWERDAAGCCRIFWCPSDCLIVARRRRSLRCAASSSASFS